MMNIYNDGQPLNAQINNIQEMDQFWRDITKQIGENQKYIKFVEIDGLTVYDGYELQIVQNFEKIQSLNIVTISSKESLIESWDSLVQYCTKVLDYLPGIYRPLYADAEQTQWEQVISLLEGMEWIVQTIEFSRLLMEQTGQLKESKSLIEQIQNSLQEHFVVMDQLLKEEDLIGFADVLQYEIEPLLIKFLQNESKDEMVE